MTREEAIQAWEQMRSEIDKENWLFVGTINPLMIDMAIEALQADEVEVVRCKDCRYANECHKSVHYTRNESNSVLLGYLPIEWCSRGERIEE